jgi:hypothetical protein
MNKGPRRPKPKNKQKQKQKQKNKAPNKNNNRNNNNKSKNAHSRGTKMAVCTRQYLASLIDPFDTNVLPCMPDFSTIQSRKARVFARGSFNTCTAGAKSGFGFICLNPFRFANNTPSTALSGLRFSSPAYLFDTINNDGGVANISVLASNADYSNSFTNTVSYRLISAGIRARFSGTNLNRGGRMFGLEDPMHNNLHGLNSGTMQSHDGCRSVSFPENDWFNVVYSPKYPLESAYIDIASEPNFQTMAQTPIAGAGQTSAAIPFCLGIIVETAAATQLITFEAYGNYEYIGDGVRGKTPSESDPLGHASVMNAMESMTPYFTRELPAIAAREGAKCKSSLAMLSGSN